jgi:hypothetical protein
MLAVELHSTGRSPTIREWCSRIQSVQSSKNPGEIDNIRARCETSKRTTFSVQRAQTMERCNLMSSASSAMAFCSAAPAPRGGTSSLRETWSDVQSRHSRQQEGIDRCDSYML